MKTKQIKLLVLTAMFIALGIVLPVAFHSIPNAGSIFLPMHIPVLLCGLLLGWPEGLACGIITPLLSSFATGMPPAAILPGMLCELAVYGATSGLLKKYVHTKSKTVDIYFQLIGSMLAGRAVSGITNALIFKAGSYSLSAFLSAAFVTALPGIAVQLVLIPVVIRGLEKAKLAP